MTCLIKGIPVVLYEKVAVGKNEWNAPVFEEKPVIVKNVLVSPVGTEDIISDLQLYGKRAEYEMSIPKGDTRNWEDSKVEFFGKTWRTYGLPQEYIEAHVPLDWNRKIRVERYG